MSRKTGNGPNGNPMKKSARGRLEHVPALMRARAHKSGSSRKPGEPDPTQFDYDDIVQQSFPASDPPPPPEG